LNQFLNQFLRRLFYQSHTKDWYAHYNSLLEQKGESVEIGCVLFNTKTKESRKVLFKHTEVDGIGAITQGMLKSGYKLEDFPRLSQRKQSLTWKHLPRILKFIYHEVAPLKSLPWKNQKNKTELKSFGPYTEVFDVATSNRIFQQAKELKGTHQSLLLKALSQAVTQYCYKEQAITRWHIPINIRDNLSSSTKGNEFTNFIIEVRPQDSVYDITRHMKKMLKLGDHIVTLFFLQIGNFRGMGKVLDQKVDKDYKIGKVSGKVNGSFSSLGRWPNKNVENHLGDDVVVPFGNVSLMNPICALNMEWHGHITMSIVMHSSIGENDNQGKELIALWKQNILQLLPS
jgi:hypothetical protein